MSKIINLETKIYLIFYFLLLVLGNFLEFIGLSSILIFLNFILDVNNQISSNIQNFLNKFIEIKFDNLSIFITIVVISFLLKNFISIINIYFKEKIIIVLQNNIAIKTYENYMARTLAFSETNSIYKILRNIMGESRKCGNYFLNILEILNDIFLIITIILFISFVDLNLFIILGLVIFPSLALYYFFTNNRINT